MYPFQCVSVLHWLLVLLTKPSTFPINISVVQVGYVSATLLNKLVDSEGKCLHWIIIRDIILKCVDYIRAEHFLINTCEKKCYAF